MRVEADGLMEDNGKKISVLKNVTTCPIQYTVRMQEEKRQPLFWVSL